MSNRKLVLTAAAVTLVVSFVRCGPGASQDPTVSLNARPRTIANNGQASTVTITAIDEQGKPGTGTVRVSSPAGSLKAGMDVELLLGSNDIQFSCEVGVPAGAHSTIAANTTIPRSRRTPHF